MKRKLILWCASLGLFGGLWAADIQSRIKVRARDFEAPAVTEEGKRSVLRGTDARHTGNDIYEIISPKVTTYNPDDTVDLEIQAGQCFFDSRKDSPQAEEAWSSTNLVVRTGDEKFSIQGVGWRWSPGKSTLSISNEVQALIRKSALATNAIGLNSGKSQADTNSPVRVTSRAFVHRGELAIFSGGVLVQDGEDTVRCETLRVQFGPKGGAERIEAEQNVHIKRGDTEATGGKAAYDIRSNLFTLEQNPQWKMGDRTGRSQTLRIVRTNNSVHANGAVFMRLPYQSRGNAASFLAPNPQATNTTGTNRILTVTADSFDYFGGAETSAVGRAEYRGNVTATDEVRGQIQSRVLVVNFSSKEQKITEVIARENVRINSGKSEATADQAVYDATKATISLTGSPKWKDADRSGNADRFLYFQERDELMALGNVMIELPGGTNSALFSPATSSQTNAPSVMRVYSDWFTRSGRQALFGDQVRVEDRQGGLTSRTLAVITGASNQVQHILAEGSVTITQKDMIGTGEKAIYSAATGLVELTGNPRIEQKDRTVVGDIFIIDRNRNTFTLRGRSWRINMRAETAQGRINTDTQAPPKGE